jgi:hypothetical protein
MKSRIYDLDVPSSGPEAPVLFAAAVPGRRPRPVALAGSVAVHAAAVALLQLVSGYLSWLHEDDVDWSRYRVEPIRLHLPQTVYFSRPAAEAPKTARAVPRKQGMNTKAATPPRRPFVSSQLELPAPHELDEKAPVILQPDFRPDFMKVPKDLPQLRFWARQERDLPHPSSPRDVVVPGRTEAPAPPPKLAAPPVAAAPNREATVSDVNVALSSSSSTPSLVVSNSTTTPVRLRTAQGAEAGAFELSAGQPANVIALAAERANSGDIEIARGLRNIPRLSTADAAGLDVAPGQTAGSSSAEHGNSPVQSSGPKGTASTAAATGADSKTAAMKDGRGKAPAQTPRTAAEAESGVNAGAVVRAPDPPELIRVQHPVTGSFDVVVMQSATPDDFADLGGGLTGDPVFTVYLRVGDRKEWLLEYCLPGRGNKQESEYQVNLDDAGSIVAPYPIATAIPKAILDQQIPRHLVFHGLLTANGSLRDVKGSDTSNSVILQMLDALKDWHFRPALRNKQAIDVEFLLVIPARS